MLTGISRNSILIFVLENLDTLRKNGRLTGLKSLAVSALNIKPVMGANPEGQICQLGQGRGMKKALAKMAEQIAADAINPTEKILAISHCNCPERAMAVEKLIREKINVKRKLYCRYGRNQQYVCK